MKVMRSERNSVAAGLTRHGGTLREAEGNLATTPKLILLHLPRKAPQSPNFQSGPAKSPIPNSLIPNPHPKPAI